MFFFPVTLRKICYEEMGQAEQLLSEFYIKNNVIFEMHQIQGILPF